MLYNIKSLPLKLDIGKSHLRYEGNSTVRVAGFELQFSVLRPVAG